MSLPPANVPYYKPIFKSFFFFFFFLHPGLQWSNLALFYHPQNCLYLQKTTVTRLIPSYIQKIAKALFKVEFKTQSDIDKILSFFMTPEQSQSHLSDSTDSCPWAGCCLKSQSGAAAVKQQWKHCRRLCNRFIFHSAGVAR